MANTVISVEHLSKRYTIGHQREKGDGLRHALERAARAPIAWLRSGFNGNGAAHEEFWALRDVSVDVKQGEVVGIIGRNGAGKSTLLKILSRITEPTGGLVRIRGRVASLLEVGTGFHPELTGRENVFLNGAILGMPRAEILRKFDQIVSFAEVERFLDTPVKRYSSGMHVRLAFSVAAHLEPEILIVDEVLAVGDTVFQKKCVDRMMEVSRTGRTVLFVTHNLSTLRALCKRAVVLSSGRLVFDGTVEEGIREYQPSVSVSSNLNDLSTVLRTAGAQELIFDRVTFTNSPLRFGEPIQIRLRLKSAIRSRAFAELDFGVSIRDKEGNYVIHCSNRFTSTRLDHDADDREYIVEIENFLKPNTYFVTLFIRSQETVQDWLDDVVSFEVADGNPYGYFQTSQIQGATLPRFSFRKEIGDDAGAGESLEGRRNA
jgi:lipopolysaccharide transport system ATP-binding protein